MDKLISEKATSIGSAVRIGGEIMTSEWRYIFVMAPNDTDGLEDNGKQ